MVCNEEKNLASVVCEKLIELLNKFVYKNETKDKL